MYNLIKNELIKIFSKKSIYIIMLVMLFFVIGTNYLYKNKIDEFGNFIDNDIIKENYLEIARKETVSDEEKLINKYILDTKYNINKRNDLRGILLNLFVEYDLFIILFSVLIPSIIITDEFNKGTIKQLLITPNSRFKIMLSKFIASLIMILFSIIVLIILELIIGGIFFSYSSLKVPAVFYNYRTNTLSVYNIFTYLLLLILNKMPMFIILDIIVLLISILTLNSAISISVGLLLYIFNPIINSLAISLKPLNYFISCHWDLSIYMFSNTTNNFNMSIAMIILYIFIMLFIIFRVFGKKDIKNI